jgi:putative FmdB family regulatory protein
MPLYPYTCKDCGDFQAWRSMAACDQSTACPRCGKPSRRAVAAPRILGMDEHTRIAHMRNEKSAHEPRVVRKEHSQHGDSHHGHGHHRHAPRSADRLEPHLHESPRRSMIGH